MADHKARQQKEGLFCAVASAPCECKNNYIEHCRPKWDRSDLFAYTYKQKGTNTKVTKVFEAHHLLCVASIGRIVVGNQAILSIVKATKWCVNDKDNMIAMPLWGHTVKWYCRAGGAPNAPSAMSPPPFADIPQHNWDHTGNGSYIEELDDRLEQIVAGVEAAKKQHTYKDGTLASDLDTLRADFRTALTDRGRRSGGTHHGWLQGLDSLGSTAATPVKTSAKGGLSGRWYFPFSMAPDDGVTDSAYPNLSFSDESKKQLEWLANKLKGLGA